MKQNPVKKLLIHSYNHHAQERDGYTISEWKAQERANFLSRLQQENKRSILEIGAGAGKDSKFFSDSEFDVTCIDLSPEMVKLCQAKGLTAHLMDVIDLQFEADSFDAAYALNSFLHIPNDELIMALENVKKVLKPGGLFYLGVYGGYAFEGIWEKDSYDPKRFFSFRTDERIQEITSALFKLLSFKSIETEDGDLHFQALTLRKPNLG